MIKIRMVTADGKPVILLGLTRENIQHLQERDPIAFNLQEVGLEGLMFIMAGEDSRDIIRQLVDAGVLPTSNALDAYREPEPGQKYEWRPE